jgi:small conductance mechanosensitive channel
MRAWLERLIPTGPVHDSLTELAMFGLNTLGIIVLYVVLRWLLLRGLTVLLAPIQAREGSRQGNGASRVSTLEGLARSAITYVLLFFAAVMLLGGLGVNVAAIVAGAGVAGLAISFGAQRLVRDVLTGFFLLMEDQFRVGEVVTLAGIPGLGQLTGTVRDMGLRITRLTDSAEKLVTVANGDIAAVVNHSRGPVTATVEIGLSPEAPLDRVRELITQTTLPDELFAGKPLLEGVTALDAAKMTIRVTAPAAPGQAPEAELALRGAVRDALRAGEIEIK